MPSFDDLEVLHLESADAWRTWLEANHAESPGVRLAIAKKGGGATSVSYQDAVDVALCFGWIDGRKRAVDAQHFVQGFGPRTAKSIWSQVNRDRVARLNTEGRMRPAGLAEVERARADGRWDAAYAPPSTIEVPDDLAAALATNDEASAMFGRLSSQNRFAILFRIGNVKRAETRERKIAEYVAMLARGETIYPQRAT